MPRTDRQFPNSIQKLWGTLKAEVIWLHGRWIIYCQLYGKSPERVDILNRSASTFFNIIQKVLLEDVQLSLSKLGDPARSGKRENLTINALVRELESTNEAEVIEKVK